MYRTDVRVQVPYSALDFIIDRHCLWRSFLLLKDFIVFRRRLPLEGKLSAKLTDEVNNHRDSSEIYGRGMVIVSPTYESGFCEVHYIWGI